jgi:phosphoheptose isomerase
MTFPEKKYAEVRPFAEDYFRRLRDAASSVDRAKLSEAAAVLDEAYRNGATLFVCGNGGSAATADSFVCDHGKLIRTGTEILPRVVSLSANGPMVTAIANDMSYDDIFVFQLSGQARKGDVLLTISASGNSENVVRAADWARNNGVKVIAFTGFKGGRTAKLAAVNVHVEAYNYGIVEDVHQSLMHILAQYVRQKYMPEREIAEAKF